MDLFNVVARIVLDSSDYERQLGEAQKKTNSFGSKLKSGLKTAAGVVAAGVAAVGTAAVAIGKQSLEAYANYEQLVGGVETLFSSLDGTVSAAPQVLENAAKAYKTAGLSANEYMETVTSFSAALVTSLNNDYDEAARIADMAIIDMSDNANKMGTSMEAIQNAYQGFAKQNYTMLDNLKLGYGGTKSEMERLLADAQKITGIEYNIDNLSDVYEAIHVIQTELGITGTTAKEASTTISGSVNAMKASWQNLLVGIADDTADINTLVDQFVDSLVTAGDNLIPRIQKILDGAVKVIVAVAEKLIPVVIQVIADNLPMLVKSALSLIKTIVTTIIDNLPQLIDAAIDIIFTLADGLIEALPELIPAIVMVITTIAEKLTEPDTLIKLIDAALQIMGAIVTGLINALPILLESAVTIIENLLTVFIDRFPELLDLGVQMIEQIKDGLSEDAQALISAAIEIWNRVKESIVEAWNSIKTAVVDRAKAIRENLSQVWENIKSTVTGKVDALKEGVRSRFENIKNTVKNAIDRLKSFFNFNWSLPKIKLPHFRITGSFSLRPPSVPHFSVEWYKKAYDNPYMFTKPTVMGFGDGNGGEIVYGHSNLMQDIAEAVKSALGSVSTQSQIINLTALLELDGVTLARKTYQYNVNETDRHGPSLVNA